MEIDNVLFGVEIEWNTNASDWRVIDSMRTAGLEVVSCSRTDFLPDVWGLKHDGSIGRGWEIVSPPCSLSRLQSDLHKFALGLKHMRESFGFPSRAGQRCGVHVHVSNVGEGTVDGLRAIARRALAFEDTLDLLLPDSRRANNNTFCRSNVLSNMAWGYNGSFDERCERMFDVLGSTGSVAEMVSRVSPSRYYKINFEALDRHGTIEWRHHGASLNATKIASWAEFVARFCLVSSAQQRVWKRKPGPQSERFRKMMRGMPSSLMRYMSDRMVRLNGSAALERA